MRAGPDRRRTRTLMMRRSVRVGVRCGLRWGREDRSAMPATPRSRVATRLPRRCGRRDLESFGRSSERPPFIDDTTSKTQPAQLRQRSVTVRHEDLRKVNAFLDSSHLTRRSSPCQLATPLPTSMVSTPRSEHRRTVADRTQSFLEARPSSIIQGRRRGVTVTEGRTSR